MPRSIDSRFSKAIAILVWSAAIWSAATAARAQTAAQTARNNTIKAKASGIVLDLRNERRISPPGEPVQTSVETVLSQEKQSGLYLLLLAPVANEADRAVNLFRVEADEARVDKQVGAASSSSGSTSLTSKGSAPAVLGFAVENGALERSVSGTAITFTGRPVQIIQALQKTPFAGSFTQIEENASLGALNRFSFGFTFDTSRDNTAGTLTASSSQLSSYSARFDVLNHRDPRDSIHNARWEALRQGVQQQANLKLLEAFNLVSESAVFKARFDEWLTPTAKALADALNAGAADDVLARIVSERLANFPSAAGIPGADAALKGDILYGQAKLTFPVKGSGVKIPISVTFANRSELNKENVVRANLGLTLDMDTIIGKLKP